MERELPSFWNVNAIRMKRSCVADRFEMDHLCAAHFRRTKLFGSFEAHFSYLHLNLLHTTLNVSSHLVTETVQIFRLVSVQQLKLAYDEAIISQFVTVYSWRFFCCQVPAK